MVLPTAATPEEVGSGDVNEEIREVPRTHTVGAGETLYAISRSYGIDVADLKRLNKLADGNISVGQVLKLVPDQVAPSAPKAPANPNQGVELIEMINDTVEEQPVDKKVVEMDVLKVEEAVEIVPGAEVEAYRDEATGKQFKRVLETGTAGPIEDFATDQTKFFAFHKYLPPGSYIRVDFPDRSQSILCEVRSALDKNDDHVVRLTAKCMEYLRMDAQGGTVKLRYVVPVK